MIIWYINSMKPKTTAERWRESVSRFE